MARTSGHPAPDKRSSTLTNGHSSLPEVDTRRADEAEGKEVQTQHGKETVLRETEGLQVRSEGTQSSGIEIAGSEDKEAVTSAAYYGDEALYRPGPAGREEQVDMGAKRRRKRRRACVVGSVILLLILGIALGVGLGVGLPSNDKKSGTLESGSTADETGSASAASGSSKGAFNGTGISMRRQGDLTNLTSGVAGTGDSDPRNLLLVYQHYTGDIRWMQRSWPDTWLGGSESESITTWGKNGTPLSLMATGSSEESKAEWHVFCE